MALAKNPHQLCLHEFAIAFFSHFSICLSKYLLLCAFPAIPERGWSWTKCLHIHFKSMCLSSHPSSLSLLFGTIVLFFFSFLKMKWLRSEFPISYIALLSQILFLFFQYDTVTAFSLHCFTEQEERSLHLLQMTYIVLIQSMLFSHHFLCLEYPETIPALWETFLLQPLHHMHVCVSSYTFLWEIDGGRERRRGSLILKNAS